jgi:hypothetical protein
MSVPPFPPPGYEADENNKEAMTAWTWKVEDNILYLIRGMDVLGTCP